MIDLLSLRSTTTQLLPAITLGERTVSATCSVRKTARRVLKDSAATRCAVVQEREGEVDDPPSHLYTACRYFAGRAAGRAAVRPGPSTCLAVHPARCAVRRRADPAAEQLHRRSAGGGRCADLLCFRLCADGRAGRGRGAGDDQQRQRQPDPLDSAGRGQRPALLPRQPERCASAGAGRRDDHCHRLVQHPRADDHPHRAWRRPAARSGPGEPLRARLHVSPGVIPACQRQRCQRAGGRGGRRGRPGVCGRSGRAAHPGVRARRSVPARLGRPGRSARLVP